MKTIKIMTVVILIVISLGGYVTPIKIIAYREINEDQKIGEGGTENEDQIEGLRKQDEKKKIKKSNTTALKKEIKRRKHYHRNLVSQYNNNFHSTHLDLITKNALIIENLRNIYTTRILKTT